MKSSGKNSLLTIGLIQEVKIRWNTRLLMLQLVEKALPEIFEVFGENFGRIQNINVEVLKKIIEFLKPFKSASDELEGDNYPTIHKSVLYKVSLQNHLKCFINLEENIIKDNGELSILSILCKIALRALDFINTKFILSEEHDMAVFLWPKFKNFKMFPLLSDRHCINVNIETKLLHIETQHNVENYDTINDVQYSIIPSSTTFSEWEDNENDIPSRYNNNRYKIELNSYRNEHLNISNENVLQFWKEHENRFFYLSKLARQILALPASSVSSERSFSIAGHLVEERRSCLDGKTLDSVLFLNSHFKEK